MHYVAIKNAQVTGILHTKNKKIHELDFRRLHEAAEDAEHSETFWKNLEIEEIVTACGD